VTTLLERIMYTATATFTGGREGHGRTDDDQLVVDLRAPVELGGPGGGTNPEQLFAVGYAACFQSALTLIARRRRVDADRSTVRSQVRLGAVPGGSFGLAVVLEVDLPGVDRRTALEVVEAAHEVCPYSNAVRGTIDVEIRVV
jgi:Ohr subfamily peroxiredoxin